MAILAYKNMLQENPPQLSHELSFDRDQGQAVIDQGLERKNGLLTELESKNLVSAYGIPVIRTEMVISSDEAERLAWRTGYPLVMKVHSADIVHKTEANGVQLNIRSTIDVVEAYRRIMEGARAYNPEAEILGVTLQPMIERSDYEILLGAKRDESFGPVIIFGMGGILTEFFKDRAIGLPPLNRSLARRLMEGTRVYSLLQGFRNLPAANLELLEEMIIRLSHLLTDFSEIAALDINPVMVSQGKPYAVDARVILKPFDVVSPLHLVISPYPAQYESRALTKGGFSVFIRPTKPEDAPLLMNLFDTLSPTSIYYRFFSPMKALPHNMLARFTQIDYDREIALVALMEKGSQERMLGVARVMG